MVRLRSLYASAHLLTSGAGTVDPDPTNTMAWHFPCGWSEANIPTTPKTTGKSFGMAKSLFWQSLRVYHG
jgi:hypothetical protein